MFGLSTKYELYTFTSVDAKTHYTSGARFITHDDTVYEPVPIDRDDIEDSGDMEKNTVGIRFPITESYPQNLLRSFLENPVIVEIFELKGGVKKFLWRGRLIGVSPDDAEIELSFESEYTELTAIGNRILFQRTCPYSIYGNGCNVDKDNFKVKTTVLSVDKLSVIVRGTYMDGLYNLGMIQHENGDYIGIEKQTGANLTLLNRYEFTATSQEKLDSLANADSALSTANNEYNIAFDYLSSLDPSDPNYETAEQDLANKLVIKDIAQLAYNNADEAIDWVYLYFGCNKTIDDCVNKFDNINNFGGFPYIPVTNPTSASMV